jgi:lipoate-protein ligase A
MIMETWYLWQSGICDPAENMAADEALLSASARIGAPLLRFYGWSQPAATFGYSQRFREIEQWTPLRPLIRRPTGGGLVPHDADWTYSLSFPPGHSWHGLKAVESYQRVHAWIQRAFDQLRVATQLADCCRKEVPGQCFAGAERFDVLWQDQKIAGAAQRRNRDGLLIQGSVQPPPGSPDRSDWERAMRVVQEVRWADFEPDPVLCSAIAELRAHKYAQPAYNQGR